MKKDKLNRREFLKIIGSGVTVALVSPLTLTGEEKQPAPGTPVNVEKPDLVVVQGDNPEKLTRKAIEAYGGMSRFVKKGDVVVVKPNIGWDRLPAQGANTNPDVVKALVEMAYEAGAKKVKVFDNSVNNPQSCYQRSGIMEKAKAAGAEVIFMNPNLYKTVKFSGTRFLTEWPIYKDVLECDVLINVPVAKTHSISKVTLSMKNLMGVIGGNRGRWHQQIDLALAELLTQVKPKLAVLDAYRVMVKNGPTGGSPNDLKLVGKCVVGTDQIAVDAYGATLLGIKPEDIGHLRIAAEMGLGKINLSELKIKEIKA